MKRGNISSFPYYDTFMRVWRDAMMSKKELALVFEQLEKEYRFSGTIWFLKMEKCYSNQTISRTESEYRPAL